MRRDERAARNVCKQLDRVRACRGDFWEAGHLVGTNRVRKGAKAERKRAARRSERHEIEEQIEGAGLPGCNGWVECPVCGC